MFQPICHTKLLRNPVYCFFLSIQQINMQTMIVKHQFQLYKLLANKLSSYQIVRLPNFQVTKLSSYQIFRLPNFQVTKFSGYKLLVTKLSSYQIVRLRNCQLPKYQLPNYQLPIIRPSFNLHSLYIHLLAKPFHQRQLRKQRKFPFFKTENDDIYLFHS